MAKRRANICVVPKWKISTLRKAMVQLCCGITHAAEKTCPLQWLPNRLAVASECLVITDLLLLPEGQISGWMVTFPVKPCPTSRDNSTDWSHAKQITCKWNWWICIYQVQKEGLSALAFFLFDFGEVLILKFICSTQSTKVSLELKYFLKVHTQCLWWNNHLATWFDMEKYKHSLGCLLSSFSTLLTNNSSTYFPKIFKNRRYIKKIKEVKR